MNDKRYKYILYIIVLVILGTIGIQVFWNYKNYLANKKQLVNDVQISLDNAVDDYYAKLAKNNTLAFAFESTGSTSFNTKPIDSLFNHIRIAPFKMTDSFETHIFNGSSRTQIIKGDSLFIAIQKDHSIVGKPRLRAQYKNLHIDSTAQNDFRILTTKIFRSLTTDSLSVEAIGELLRTELDRKKLNLDYKLSYIDPERATEKIVTFTNSIKINETQYQNALLSTISKSAFLPKGSTLTVLFTNQTKIILKGILTGILISTLLVLAVISCLFYLLKIIKHQKQLAEVKNDLISNITHEFKTPIATISVALESIKNFNVIDDKEKTKKYLDMSNDQLSKLNVMVEKLLETASLDSDSLELNKESINLVDLLNSIINKHHILTTDNGTSQKTINLFSSEEIITAMVDVFHFENAINNIVDNAFKYGGNEINISLTQDNSDFTISIADNGSSLTKANKDKVFEKFYRVSKGNTHDVKGFGIGLYYTKKIIEKHGGVIHLNLDKNSTTFKMSLPNE